MGSLRFKWQVTLFILPALLLYGVFFLVPFGRTLYFSLHQWNGFSDAKFVGLANYVRLLSDELYLAGVGRILIWAALAVLLKVGFALILANILRQPIPGYRFFTTAFFIPVVISSAAISLLFTLLYDNEAGLVNVVLRAVGLGALATTWLANSDTALYALIAVPIWHTIGYFFIILLAAIQNVPRDYYEVARIEGADSWQVFRFVTVPSVWPTLQVCIILAITSAFKSFDYVFVMTRGGPGTATQVPATYMYDTIFVGLEFGYGTAIATSIFLLGLSATLIVRWLTVARA
jgi:raffinose/stachyose/melibiose transport system permease protein